MKPISRTAATIRRGKFIRSRFIHSLKEKTAEQMDGGLNCPPILFPFPPTKKRSEQMGMDGNR